MRYFTTPGTVRRDQQMLVSLPKDTGNMGVNESFKMVVGGFEPRSSQSGFRRCLDLLPIFAVHTCFSLTSLHSIPPIFLLFLVSFYDPIFHGFVNLSSFILGICPVHRNLLQNTFLFGCFSRLFSFQPAPKHMSSRFSVHNILYIPQTLRTLMFSVTYIVSQLSRCHTWLHHFLAFYSCFFNFMSISSHLDKISVDFFENAKTRSDVQGLARKTKKLETGVLAWLWHRIQDRMNMTSKILQNPQAIDYAVFLLSSLQEFIASLRPQFDLFERRGHVRNAVDSFQTKHRTTTRIDDGWAEGTRLISARDDFKVDSFLVSIDKLTSVMSDRIKGYGECIGCSGSSRDWRISVHQNTTS